jgi:hypothetical protein
LLVLSGVKLSEMVSSISGQLSMSTSSFHAPPPSRLRRR